MFFMFSKCNCCSSGIRGKKCLFERLFRRRIYDAILWCLQHNSSHCIVLGAVQMKHGHCLICIINFLRLAFFPGFRASLGRCERCEKKKILPDARLASVSLGESCHFSTPRRFPCNAKIMPSIAPTPTRQSMKNVFSSILFSASAAKILAHLIAFIFHCLVSRSEKPNEVQRNYLSQLLSHLNSPTLSRNHFYINQWLIN